MKVFLLSLYFLIGFVFSANAQPKYEFRGVWVASVANIDWPPKGMTETEKQKAEFIRQLDLHKRNGMNAVIVQVRPAADAFYPSPYEPWSQWLTGKQGKPPSPYYDPMQFMIEEAHKRGMEFHAWCNPYRADFSIGSSSIAPTHITKIHPEWFLSYGGKKYFDPGNSKARQFVVDVIKDIVSRYDIDAIHMDDYFYPYRVAGKEFPDESSYKKTGSKLDKDDWRRSNVDTIIKALSIAIKKENPHCRFGISPFSVWRNKSKDPRGSDSKAAQTNYDDLYADILLWLKEGWIDYVAPQLYLEIGNSRIDFEKMLDWWSKNVYGKHLYIGIGIYRAGSNTAWENPKELPNQLKLLRKNDNVQGSIFYSSNSFDKNPKGWNDSLRNNYFKMPSLVPPMEWIDNNKPGLPVIEKRIENDSLLKLTAVIDPNDKASLKYFLVYRITSSAKRDGLEDNSYKNLYRIIIAKDKFEFTDTLTPRYHGYRYLIVAVNRNNNESDPKQLTILEQPDGGWSFIE